MSAPQRTFSEKTALALLLLTLGVVALYLMRPIADPDFFWHLSTGQWILQHQSLPVIDPFSLAPPAADNLRSSFILTSYWLSQILFAALYALGGWWGIALLRLALVGALMFLFAHRCGLRQPLKVSLFLLVVVQILEVYPLERPQIFSVIFFAALLVLLDRYREQGEDKKDIGLFAAMTAALMLLWSNLHGGFLVGQVTLLLSLVMEGGKFFHPALRPLSKQRYAGLSLMVLAGLAASLLNPNGIDSFKILFQVGAADSFLFATNMEYYSSLRSFREFGDVSIIINWLMMSLVAVGVLASIRRIDIFWLSLLAGTAVMGCRHVRYMPFFLVAALFFLGQEAYAGRLAIPLKITFVTLSLIAVGWLVRDEGRFVSPFIRGEWGVERGFPTTAADFVLQKKLPGPVYNTYLWGGYLIWRLGPERKIFCDGRQLDSARYWEYLSSTMMTQGAEPYWRGVFEKHGIKTVIVQMLEPGGQMNPLVNSLRRDSEWGMVFAKDNAAIFIRR